MDTLDKSQEYQSNGTIIKEILKIGIPAFVTMLSFVAIEVMTVVFNGHLGDAAMIAGAGLGSMFTTMVCIAITSGLNSTLSTLISQTYGQGNLHMCGIYLNRARIIVTIVFIPITIALLNAENIFDLIGIDPMISHYAQVFIIYRLPHCYFYSQYDATKRLLYNAGFQNTPMVIQIVTTVIHPLWCYLFVHVCELDVRGTALAQSLSSLLNIVVLCIYISTIKGLKEAWFLPNRDCFKGLLDYMRLGVYATCLIWLEWCAFEFMTLMTGYLDVDSMGAQIVLYNFECLIFMPTLALQIASSALVGKYIGAYNVNLAKRYSMLTLAVCAVNAAIIIAAVLLLKVQIAELYTNVEGIQIKVENCLMIIALVQLVNQPQAVQQGILRGLGKVGLATLIALVSYYGFAIPIAYVFTFHIFNDGQGLGLNGVWYGLFFGQFVLVASYQFFISIKFDWNQIVQECRERTERDQKLISKSNKINDKEAEEIQLV